MTHQTSPPHAQRVTVSIPYFRCKPYICRAVESILEQTYHHLTVVVVNDGDPEPPWDQLAHIDDPRLVRLNLAANYGRYFVDAVVLNATPDPYFAVQDADDWSEPQRLEVLLHSLLADQADGVISASYQHRLQDHLITPIRISRFAAVQKPLTAELVHIANHTGLFRCTSLRDIGGYYGGFRIGYDTFLINCLRMIGTISYVDEPLYHTLLRPESLTHSQATGKGTLARREVGYALQKMYDEVFVLYTRYVEGKASKASLIRVIRKVCKSQSTQEYLTLLSQETQKVALVLHDAPHMRRLVPGHTQGCGSVLQGQYSMPQLMVDTHLTWNAWTISKRLALALAQHLEQAKPKRILEIGSGTSTVVLAQYAAQTQARVVTLEHDEAFYQQTHRVLTTLGLINAIELRLAPLIMQQFPSDMRYPWYHVTLKGSFDFIFVDGPPLKYGRQAVLLALADHLDTRWELWMKDGKRAHERACVEIWRKQMRFTSDLRQTDYRGVWVLTGTREDRAERAVSLATSQGPAPTLPRYPAAQRQLIALARRMGQATEERTCNLGFGYLYYGLTRLYKPNIVVCIGSYRGFAPVCFTLGLVDNNKGMCYFIDPGKVDRYWHEPENIAHLERTFGMQGWWQHVRKTSQQVIAEGVIPGPIDLLFIDGDHSYAGVKFDFDHFGRQVCVGGLIVLHDATNVGKGFTVWEVKKFLEAEVHGKPQYDTFTFPFAAGLALVRKLE